MKNIKIFYFGGSSFVSQYLLQDLIKQFNVTCFSRRKVKNCNNYYFDLNKEITRSFSAKINNIKPDYIFFFSSYVPIKEEESSWSDCKKTNVLGLINLLKHIKFKPKKIIISSSCSIYGNKEKVFNEKSFLDPSTGYSLSKFSQEHIIRIFCKINKIKFLSYRLGYVIGDNMKNERIVRRIWSKIKKKKIINIYNKNKNLNLIHTKDISSMILGTFKKAEGIFNLTYPKKTTLQNFYLMARNNKDLKTYSNNNYKSNKFFHHFKKIKILKFKEVIKKFKNAN
jgi:nucleoside-diphosphate-sugar epimerase